MTETRWWQTEPVTDLAALLPEVARRSPDAVLALRRDGREWRPVTAREQLVEVAALAQGLVAAGVAAGDRVGLMCRTRYEWTLVDLALWTVGAVPVAIYDSSSAAQVSWILADSGAVGLVVEGAAGARLADQVRSDLPALREVWTVDPVEGWVSIDELAARGGEASDEELAERRATLARESVATLIYTSGTTGRPKGCVLTHDNLLCDAETIASRLPEVFAGQGSSCLFFLPYAHVLGRVMEVALLLSATTVGHTDPGRLGRDLATLRPTCTVAVPRVLDHLLDGARRRAARAGRAAELDHALEVATAWSQAREEGRADPALGREHAACEPAYAEVRALLGGRLRHVISGGAPLGSRLAHRYEGMGVTVLEGYGLTESTGAATVNAVGERRIGSVGRPMPGFEARVDETGELWLRGRHVFRGYWGDRAATAAMVDDQGWLRTGDLARIEDGYVWITGRAKDVVVTSGGKNVAPAPLEALLREHPLVSEALVVGDGRPSIGALVTLDQGAVDDWLAGRGREPRPVAELVEDPALRAEVHRAVDRANASVSEAEQVARFAILPEELTESAGHLTATSKVRRDAVLAYHADAVEALYRQRRRGDCVRANRDEKASLP